MADYVLPHTIPQEDERLTLMSRMLDPQMFFRLEQLGVAQGWSCLEVGAGNGSVSHWLAGKVGPKGHVFASDIERAFSTGFRCRTSRFGGSTSPATRSARATTWSAAGQFCTTFHSGSTCSAGSSRR